MLRYYIKFSYNYNPVTDSEYYKIVAEEMLIDLMRWKSSLKKAKICISAKEELTIDELKQIIKYLWESSFSRYTGSYRGFDYKNIKPNSFIVDIERVEEKYIIETSLSIPNISDKIIECYTECDNTNILTIDDKYKALYRKYIQTIADCLQ